MGGKRWKDREYILFYGACILILLFFNTGCISPIIQRQQTVYVPFELATSMLREGNYDGALELYSEVYENYREESPGDRALFDMGLIWAYPDNPKMNYDKALKYFRQVLQDYPNSALKDEARAWTETIYKVFLYESKIKDLEGEIISYREQISALKEIDIGIEEKKRKGSSEE